MVDGAIIEAPPLGHDELHLSHVSRTAALNGLPNARELCRDFEMDFPKLARGDDEQLLRYSAATGVDLATLQRNALVAGKPGHFTINGQGLIAQLSRLTSMHVCPECVRDDLRANPGLSPAAAVRWRRDWAIAGIETCAMHSRGVVFFSRQVGGNHERYHTSLTADEIDGELPTLLDNAPRRPLSAAEEYFRSRLDGASADVEHLRDLPLHAAITLCSSLGQIELDPTASRRPAPALDDRYEIIAAGFSRIVSGFAAVHDMLVRQLRASKNTRSRVRVIQTALLREVQGAEMPAILRTIDQALLEFSEGSRPLGGSNSDGRLCSIAEISRRHSIGEGAARRIAVKLNLLEPAWRPNGNPYVRADEFASIFKDGAGIIGQRRAREFLGASSGQFDALMALGHLSPFSDPGAIGSSRQFLRMDVDGLIERFDRVAPMADEAPSWAVSFSKARNTAISTNEAVFEAVFSGDVRAARLPGLAPCAGLVVDLEDLRRQLRRQSPDGQSMADRERISIAAFAVAAGIRHATAHHLATKGLLSEHLGDIAASGETVPALSSSGAAKFRERYILNAEISRILGISRRAAWVRMKAERMEPVFDASECGARIYLRSDFEARFGGDCGSLVDA